MTQSIIIRFKQANGDWKLCRLCLIPYPLFTLGELTPVFLGEKSAGEGKTQKDTENQKAQVHQAS